MRINRHAYESLIDDDISDVPCDNQRQSHIRHVLCESVRIHYELLPALRRILERQGTSWRPSVDQCDVDIVRRYVESEFYQEEIT